MATKILMPKMSDTMTEGVIASWLKKIGDTIKPGDCIIAEIETDKATMEYEENVSGVILYQVPEKSTIVVDGLIAIVGKAGEDFSALLSNSNTPISTPISVVKEEIKEIPAPIPIANSSNIKAKIIQMPKMSDTMVEGVIAAWHKKVGDSVKNNELLLEIETDKATMEFESYEKGTLLYIAGEKGSSVKVDDLLCVIGEPDADYKTLIEVFKSGNKTTPQSTLTTENTNTQITPTPNKVEVSTSSQENGRMKISPLAKKLAEEKGINLKTLQGSGEGGRVIKRDIDNYVPSPAPTQQTTSQASSSSVQIGQENFEEIPVSQMRKTIAKRLAESKFTAPHFYLTMEIRMDNAMAAREQMNAIATSKISFNDMVVKATAMALKQHPAVNSSWLGDKIRINHHVHIGVAVAVEDGLLVPVIRFADQKSLSQISAETKDLAGKAKTKKLQPADWAGNTFSISNLGMFGIDEFTAIINPPDACIMAIGAIKQTAVVENGQLVIGNIMKVTLSCDHRVVDGASGAAFLKTFKDLLEAPVRMLV
ncbi:MAG: pyruvate dehydrogenase complex dihydrolipoamide acetyltransferase [Bacteroidetes bacterium]|nr:MAG: pyruvate dehydrogenase complex dihydrolipoamide acetyltransferase [Bacteroidota bacterium]TAG89211.1 MAG: pyruvate dehydrogenase complex dihydrolipoamide acetyltransferase [Bacteroidota bacterium]